MEGSCCTQAKCARRACSGSARMSTPFTVTLPLLGSYRRSSRLTTLDLPQPLAPTSATKVPAGMSRSRPLRAGGAPARPRYCSVTFLMARAARGGGGAGALAALASAGGSSGTLGLRSMRPKRVEVALAALEASRPTPLACPRPMAENITPNMAVRRSWKVRMPWLMKTAPTPKMMAARSI